jgi:peptidyl-prolyl cis-trans isomerase-like 1
MATWTAAGNGGGADSQSRNVVLETSLGPIGLELYWNHAPKTCRNFSELARRKYYDGTLFHRIIKDFMVQGGDPTGTGRGGESIYGATFEDEITRELKHTGAGILSMANAGANTNGSQFFLTLAPTPWLDGKVPARPNALYALTLSLQHTIFGRVSSGMQTVKKLGLVSTDSNDRPLQEVKILSARVY